MRSHETLREFTGNCETSREAMRPREEFARTCEEFARIHEKLRDLTRSYETSRGVHGNMRGVCEIPWEVARNLARSHTTSRYLMKVERTCDSSCELRGVYRDPTRSL